MSTPILLAPRTGGFVVAAAFTAMARSPVATQRSAPLNLPSFIVVSRVGRPVREERRAVAATGLSFPHHGRAAATWHSKRYGSATGNGDIAIHGTCIRQDAPPASTF